MTPQPMLRIIEPESSCIQVPEIDLKDFNVWFHDTQILYDINLSFPQRQITCIIGPSGSGKSTLIRSMNRINDDLDGFDVSGTIMFDGKDIYRKSLDVTLLRKEIGMVFQKPCVFPKSISENVLFGVECAKRNDKHERLRIVEENLKAVSLWKEVSHRLHEKAGSLSIGQQQRLCIARTLAVKPKVILLDEPTSSLDPTATRAIEALMLTLKKSYAIVFVTHNIRQARRIADNLVFMCDGKVIEHGTMNTLCENPKNEQTRTYLNDEYCEC